MGPRAPGKARRCGGAVVCGGDDGGVGAAVADGAGDAVAVGGGRAVLGLVVWRVLGAAGMVHVDTAALEAMTVFKPVAAFGAMHDAVAAVLPAAKRSRCGCCRWRRCVAGGGGGGADGGAAEVGWGAAGAAGDDAGVGRAAGGVVDGGLGAVGLGSVEGGAITITGPAARGGEPSIVLYSAILICGTLAGVCFVGGGELAVLVGAAAGDAAGAGGGGELERGVGERGGAGQADRDQPGDDDCEDCADGVGDGVFGVPAAVCECGERRRF